MRQQSNIKSMSCSCNLPVDNRSNQSVLPVRETAKVSLSNRGSITHTQTHRYSWCPIASVKKCVCFLEVLRFVLLLSHVISPWYRDHSLETAAHRRRLGGWFGSSVFAYRTTLMPIDFQRHHPIHIISPRTQCRCVVGRLLCVTNGGRAEKVGHIYTTPTNTASA